MFWVWYRQSVSAWKVDKALRENNKIRKKKYDSVRFGDARATLLFYWTVHASVAVLQAQSRWTWIVFRSRQRTTRNVLWRWWEPTAKCRRSTCSRTNAVRVGGRWLPARKMKRQAKSISFWKYVAAADAAVVKGKRYHTRGADTSWILGVR